MVARKGIINLGRNERGQSLLEFLLMLPVILGLIVIMTHVNQAIQESIVDQQYARMQTLWLTFNSPVYPRLTLVQSNLVQKNYNQMAIGVAENEITGDGAHPSASTQMIARTPAAAAGGSDTPQSEPPMRANVRIRNTVSLCTQPAVLGGQAILPLAVSGSTIAAVGPYNFPENAKFDYCRGLSQ